MIEQTIKDIAKKLPMSSGDNLLGFKIDCDALIDDDSFLLTEVVETEDPLNMLSIRIEIDTSIPSIQRLTEIVGDLFKNVEYQHFSCHSVVWTEKSFLFRFITVISGDQFYVSGTIEVVGTNYQKLYRNNQAAFRK